MTVLCNISYMSNWIDIVVMEWQKRKDRDKI